MSKVRTQSKSNQIVLTRNGKINQKKKKLSKSKPKSKPISLVGPVGPQGPAGPPGQGFSLESITPFVDDCDHQSCRRVFVFGDLRPSMFSQYDGYMINNKLHQLEKSTSRQQFNQYLMAKHGLKAEDDGQSYSTHLPSQISSFAVKPTGFVNPNTIPPNCLTSQISDHTYQFLVVDQSDQELHLLDCPEITSLIKDVVHREQIIHQSCHRSISDQIITDSNGEAVIELPLGTEINHCTYTLTPIGQPAPNLHVSEEVTHSSNRLTFKIAGGQPNQKISWMLKRC